MDYPNTGALFTSTKKINERSPDMYGDIKFDKAYLMEKIEAAKGSDEVTIKLDGWVKRDKNNNRMVSLKVNTYVKPGAAKERDPWDD